MLPELAIDMPIEKVLDDWDLLEAKVAAKFSSFREAGQNIFGIRRRAIARAEVIDLKKGKFESLQIGPTGIIGEPRTPMHMHITAAGTPHRIPHSLGYWHINDMDELYFPVPGEGDELGYFIVIMQTPRDNEGESFAWYCERCVTLVHEIHYRSGILGLKDFWRAEDNAVRDFNGDVRHRTCPECGHLNPLGYTWNVAKDTDEQRAARALW